MISAHCFVASKDLDEQAWLAARRAGVTATMVAKSATKSGMADLLENFGSPVHVNNFMAWGTAREPVIADWVKREFGIMPNSWLISAGEPLSPERWMLCTPDGLSLDHSEISEIKTGGTVTPNIRIDHRRQIQWQLHVTGAERCLYVFEHRKDAGDDFEPGELSWEWVYPDTDMQDELLQVARTLQDQLVFRSWEEAEDADE